MGLMTGQQITGEATARIIGATALDGSALDSPLTLDYCGTGQVCQSIPDSPAGNYPGIKDTAGSSGSSFGLFDWLPGSLKIGPDVSPDLKKALNLLTIGLLVIGGVIVINAVKR